MCFSASSNNTSDTRGPLSSSCLYLMSSSGLIFRAFLFLTELPFEVLREFCFMQGLWRLFGDEHPLPSIYYVKTAHRSLTARSGFTPPFYIVGGERPGMLIRDCI